MQLDQTRIAIRERSFPAILDLGLHVTRANFGPLLFWLAIGATPFLLADYALLYYYPEPQQPNEWTGYFLLLAMLIVWQLPLATAPVTLYLGRAMFAQHTSVRKLLADLAHALPQLFWYQLVLRGLLTPWCIPWFYLFVSRPFLNEVILLERTPFRRRPAAPMSTGRRTSALHAAMQGELFARWLLALLFGAALLASAYLSVVELRDVLLGAGTWGWRGTTLALPLVLWLVIGYFTVVRFLAYLDLRIRREGWEVELLMRAEAARLSKQWT